MDIPPDQIAEFYRHQALLLPYSSQHLGRINLDIGCGTGLPSVIHHERLGIQPTLCDVVDMRHGSALAFPFFLLKNETLPFRRKTFVSSYIQYVLHHLTTAPEVLRLLEEALRVSEKVIIVEEVAGAKTDIVRAELFDRRMNAKLHPNMPMPVYRYYSLHDIERLVADADGEVQFHSGISKGDDDNGFLETHLLVATANQ